MHGSTPPLCILCVHAGDDIGRGCDAFPDGIPQEILDGMFDHRERYGDETILFEKDPRATDDQLAAWEELFSMDKVANAALSLGIPMSDLEDDEDQ